MLIATPTIITAQKTAIARNAQRRRRRSSASLQFRGSAPSVHERDDNQRFNTALTDHHPCGGHERLAHDQRDEPSLALLNAQQA